MRIVVEELRYETLDQSFIVPFKPYSHQAKTVSHVRDAIAHNKTICIQNTSVTGSGKTLANFAAAILDGTPTCGVYPTNELVMDQYLSLQKDLAKNALFLLDSQGMDEVIVAHPHMRSHAQAINWASGDFIPLALLTNPDVLYLAMFNLYGHMFSTFSSTFGDRTFQNMLNNYPVIAFDEFHLYNRKQVANAVFLMGIAKTLAPHKPHVFIFSSATPLPHFQDDVDRLGIKYIDVTSKPSPTGSNVVCEQVEINILPADLLRWQGVEQIQSHLNPILDWADSFPPGDQARGVFIVDGVYDAKLLASTLRQRYPSPRDVGEVHGYMHRNERAGALLSRFSVGTTTIDVGVDLVAEKQKEFLVCEARGPAQAIQRIGRLGRSGRDKSIIQTQIPNRVWLFVPEYVYQYLCDHVQDGDTIVRDQLNLYLNAAYLGNEGFSAYNTKYSPLEAVAACERATSAPYFGDEKLPAVAALQQLIATLYVKQSPITPEQATDLYQKYKKKQYAIWKNFGTEIKSKFESKNKKYYLSDLESFRGGMESDFTVVIYDELDKRLGLKPIKTYNLPFVLRRTQHRELSQQRFEDLIRGKNPQQQAADWISELTQQRQPLGYIHVSALVEGKANNCYFELGEAMIRNRYHQVFRLESGLTIDSNASNWLSTQDSINGQLETSKLNCWVSERNTISLSKSLHLPPLFALYPLHILSLNGRYSEGSIAFGLHAFFLECIARKIVKNRVRSADKAIIL